MSNYSLPFEVEAGSGEISTDNGDPARKSYEISSENNEYVAQMSNNNGSVKNDHVPLPRKSKACFFLSYSSFLISYLVFLLVTANTYPLKPVCNIKDSDILELLNSTEKVKDIYYLVLKFINRNPLISISYDGVLNITIDYVTSGNEYINFANTTAPGFYQRKQNQTDVTVYIPAPGFPQLSQMQKNGSGVFQVNLEFNVSFRCKVPCKKKRRLMTLEIPYLG
ncbi:hypothetical protein L1887_27038 [Cichorium endivia]|nr:hypothetical protein L1887_27038 [Cichorium endivia]